MFEQGTATLLINKHGEAMDQEDTFRWDVYLRGKMFDGAVLVDISRDEKTDLYSITITDALSDDPPGLPDIEGLEFCEALDMAPKMAAMLHSEWHKEG